MFDKMNLKPLALRLLVHLARSPGKEFYLRELVGVTGASLGGCHGALSELRALGLAKSRTSGRNLYHTVNETNPAIIHFKVFANLLETRPLVEALKPLSAKVVLFGSCATGADTLESDVDLLVVTGDEAGVRAAVKKITSSRVVKPIIMSPQKLLNSRERDPAFHSEIDKGIVLYRSEDERV